MKALSLARRGIKVGAQSSSDGELQACCVTFTERNRPTGYSIHQLTASVPKIYAVFRSPKIPSEKSLAVEKQRVAFLPSMVDKRERIIERDIDAHNQHREFLLSQGLSVGDMPVKTREMIDLSEYRMGKTMDGCGSELNAMTEIIGSTNNDDYAPDSDNEGEGDTVPELHDSDDDSDDDGDDGREDTETEFNTELPSMLPPFTDTKKHSSQGTGYSQAHDTAKSHGIVRKSSKDPQKTLKVGRDEGKVPSYLSYFFSLMKANKIPAKSQRTFGKFMTNLPQFLSEAFCPSVLQHGYDIAGQGVFDLRAFLAHWAADEVLTEDDFVFIEFVFPFLVDIARKQGTIHPSVRDVILGNFIYQKHIDNLSPEAIKVLAREEANKPEEERPVNTWGSVILTNPGHREEMRARAVAKQQAAAESEEASAAAAVAVAIQKAEELAKREAAEAKKQERIRQQHTEAQTAFAHYQGDNDRAAAEEEHVVETWKKLKAPVIASAYAIFIKPTLQVGVAPATTKTDMIPVLREKFHQMYTSQGANPAAAVAMDMTDA